MKFRQIVWMYVVVFTITLGGCALFEGGSSEGNAASSGAKAQFEELYAKAEKALKDLSSAGGAWAFTEETLAEARTLADKQDYDKAIKMTKDAMAETEIALQQHQSQKNAGPYLF